MPDYLARYTERAKRMSVAELLYAIGDITTVLDIWREDDTSTNLYLAQRYAEFDAYAVELHRRRTGKESRPC